MDKITAKFVEAVRCGREVLRAEALLHDAESRLQLARLKLKEVEEDLLGMLPAHKPNVRIRLSFALASSATADNILESISH
jgi:hypothetical protein